jgi:hypothetical protein
MHCVLIGLVIDTVYVLHELNIYLFRDNFDTAFSLITELLFPSHIIQQLIPITLPLLPKPLPCLQPTFTAMTSGHSLGTSRQANFSQQQQEQQQ